MTTTTTEAAQVPTAIVTLGALADAAKVIRKAAPDRRRRITDAPLLHNHVVITPRNIAGGDPHGVMVSMAGGTLTMPDHQTGYIGALAVPFDVIAEASKRARKLSATIRPGALEREDGATFTWRDPDIIAYGNAWRELHDAFGEPVGAAALSARFAVGEYMTAIGAVLPAVSRDESRPVLCNVMMRTPNHVTSGEWAELEVAATDSYRLHVATIRAHVEASDASPVLIPAKAAAITTMVKGADIVDVDARESSAQRAHVTLRGPGAYPTGAAHPDYMMRVSFRREDAQYPNVSALRPSEHTHTVSGVACVDAAQAAGVMMTAGDVAKAHGASGGRGVRPVIMYAEQGADGLRVSVRESDAAPGGEWTIPADVFGCGEAGDGEVGALGKYVADALQSVATTAADAVVTFHGPLRPMLIAQAEADAATAPVGLWCVVMPIRI